MFRLQKLLNHLPCEHHVNAPLSNDTRINTTFNITDEYKCRFVLKSDHEAVQEICSTVFGGKDFVASDFDHYFDDNKLVFIGCEYVPESKIIAVRLIKIIDGGITAFSFGARMHPKHRNKHIFTKFKSRSDAIARTLYPTIKRFRATTAKSYKISLKLMRNMGMYYLPNYCEYIWCHIVHPNLNADGCWQRDFKVDSLEFNNRLNAVLDDKNDIDIKRVYDSDHIIKIIKHKFDANALCINWKVFDLTLGPESINDAKLYLNKLFGLKRLEVWIDSNNNCLCMIHIDERETQFYVLSNDDQSGDENATTISLINMMFKKWLNGEKITVGNSAMLSIKIRKTDVNNKNMKELCHGFDSLIVTEKML